MIGINTFKTSAATIVHVTTLNALIIAGFHSECVDTREKARKTNIRQTENVKILNYYQRLIKFGTQSPMLIASDQQYLFL